MNILTPRPLVMPCGCSVIEAFSEGRQQLQFAVCDAHASEDDAPEEWVSDLLAPVVAGCVCLNCEFFRWAAHDDSGRGQAEAWVWLTRFHARAVRAARRKES